MSDRNDETVAFRRGGGSGPPTSTAPIYLPGGQPPSRGRRFLIYLLVLLLGLAGGFAASQFLVPEDDGLPDPDLVFYENASATFPIDGAAFTSSTFDSATEDCDKEQLKRSLRADPYRFIAWLDLQEISETEFDDFVDRLETKLLDRPTPVTNHGCFAEGEGDCPFAIQSVLGPGTPVWFDPQQNRAVAKCTCSNPLRDPRCPPNCEDLPPPTPTATPTSSPTSAPTPTPTEAPTPAPTPEPTPSPTAAPTPIETSPPAASPQTPAPPP